MQFMFFYQEPQYDQHLKQLEHIRVTLEWMFQQYTPHGADQLLNELTKSCLSLYELLRVKNEDIVSALASRQRQFFQESIGLIPKGLSPPEEEFAWNIAVINLAIQNIHLIHPEDLSLILFGLDLHIKTLIQ